MKFRPSKSEESERRVGEEAKLDPGRDASVDGAVAYRQVGDEVAAVLTAAERAAAELRETALREAEQTRLDADEKAAAVLAETQARQAELDRYREESRAAADAYAEETRRNADEQAARKVSDAEEQARRIRADAEERIRQLEAEAGLRRDAVTKNVETMEARIEFVRSAFRGVVDELDQLLPTERQGGAGELELPAAEGLDGALRPASSHAG